jgi:hypothetical protein
MRGAKSNVLFLRRANWNLVCPRVALVIRTTLVLCLSVAISGADCSAREMTCLSCFNVSDYSKFTFVSTANNFTANAIF